MSVRYQIEAAVDRPPWSLMEFPNAEISIAISLKRMADAAEHANKILADQLAQERVLGQGAGEDGTGSEALTERGTDSPTLAKDG